jgi:ankyrin repeat protein
MKNSIIILVVFVCFSFSKCYSQKLTNAVIEGNFDKVQEIIKNGGNVNEHSSALCFPLLNAVYHKNLQMVDLLLKNGAKFEPCPDEHPKYSLWRLISSSPLFWALYLKQTDIAKRICEDEGFDISKKIDVLNFTYPIIISALFGDSIVFNLLLERGADVTVKDFYGNNALMVSCSNNNLNFFNKLLPRFSSINDTSRIGYTALMLGAKASGINFEIINSLINKGADLNYTNIKNESAFSLACLHNNRELAFYLFEHGASINECDFESNARMFHFSGDYYLAKSDIKSSKEHYLKAKQHYSASIQKEREELSKVNGKKAVAIVGDVLAASLVNLASSSIQANQMQSWQNLGFSKSNAYLMTMPYAENLRKIYSPVFKDNEILLYDYRLPAGASLDEQKVFYKNKIKQFEMSIELIDSVLACMEKGLTGEELNSCISSIQLSEKSK